MKLYLVQHAQAKDKSEDPARPLSQTGRKDIYKVASFLVGQAGAEVDHIIHSGKTRARETAEALATALRPEDGVEESDGLAPLDDPAIWASRLLEMREDTMLVGHLPHMSRLASLLLANDPEPSIVSFQMGGVLSLISEEPGKWEIEWMMVPQLLD
jgi:phosphohistidine phosphatase